MNIKTRDMYLAAILVSYGSPVVEVDKSNPKRQYFHFDIIPQLVYIRGDRNHPELVAVDDLSHIQSLYLSKMLFFPPNFVDCLQSVKSYLYSEQ